MTQHEKAAYGGCENHKYPSDEPWQNIRCACKNDAPAKGEQSRDIPCGTVSVIGSVNISEGQVKKSKRSEKQQGGKSAAQCGLSASEQQVFDPFHFMFLFLMGFGAAALFTV